MSRLVLYGAYGYSGELIARELRDIGLKPLLSGRNERKLAATADSLGLDYKAASLDDQHALHDLLSNAAVIINAAGPFSATARPVIKACIDTETHYVDITGEWQVYEYAKTQSEQARKAGVMLLPGAGFDVVPSDCLAVHLKKSLPDATSLRMAFTVRNSFPSRGTARTMIEGASAGQVFRKDHKIKSRRLGKSFREVDFGTFRQLCAGISWGDISTAYTSTGIPDIEIFTGTSEKQLSRMRWMGHISPLMNMSFVQSWLKKQVDKRPPGPDKHRREQAEAWFWGEVSDGIVTSEARLKTPDGYTLTAMTASRIADFILEGNFRAGYQTPALVYGSDFITTFPGTGSFF